MVREDGKNSLFRSEKSRACSKMTVALTRKSLISLSEWEKCEKPKRSEGDCAQDQVQYVSTTADLGHFLFYLS